FRRMQNAAIDWVSVDIVGARRFEPSIGVSADRASGIAERAPDVDVYIVAADDHSGVVATPRADDLGDRRRGRGGAGDRGEDCREEEDPRHTETVQANHSQINMAE